MLRLFQALFAGGLVVALALLPASSAHAVQADWANAVTGLWTTAANWNPPTVPDNGPVDTFDVSIGAIGLPYTVGLDTDITIDSLSLNSGVATLEHVSGEFRVLGVADLSEGTFSLNGGTLVGGVWTQNGGTFQVGSNGGVLDGVTLNSLLAVGPGGRATLRGGTSLGSDVFLFATASLTIESDLNFNNGGTFTLLGGNPISVENSSTFTLGPGTQLSLTDGSTIESAFSAGTVVNRGFITVNGPGALASINPTVFDNQGIVEVSGGATLSIAPNVDWRNSGVYRVGAGSTLEVMGELPHVGGAELTGGGMVNFVGADFNNQALVRPGDDVGTLTIAGDYLQGPAGVLEIEVGGLTAGVTHDQLELIPSDTTELGGRLDVPLVNGFVPNAGDTITVLTGAGGPGGIIGQFSTVTSPNLAANAPGLAITPLYQVDSVQVTFSDVVADNTFVGSFIGGDVSWEGNWSSGDPFSVNATLIDNQSGVDLRVNLTAATNDVQVHELVVQGTVDANTTISVSQVTLSATTQADFQADSRLELGDAAGGEGTVAASAINVQADAVVAGNGTLRGDVTLNSGATLSPGFSTGATKVEGDYTQATGSVLVIEVEDSGGGLISDTLEITGDPDLGGVLLVNALGVVFDLELGETLQIIDADNLVDGDRFDAVETVGGATTEGDRVYFRPDYDTGDAGPSGSVEAATSCGGGVCLGIFQVGDMNADGIVDGDDVTPFAIALTDPVQYFTENFIFGDQSGDLDANGRLDFDDIEMFALAVDASEAEILAAIAALSVPEPLSVWLAVAALSPAFGRRRRGS